MHHLCNIVQPRPNIHFFQWNKEQEPLIHIAYTYILYCINNKIVLQFCKAVDLVYSRCCSNLKIDDMFSMLMTRAQSLMALSNASIRNVMESTNK